MSDESPNNNDIQLVFKKLRAIPTNKWFQEKGLVPNNPNCTVCQDEMKTKVCGENPVNFFCRKTSNNHDSCFDCNAKLPTWSSVTYGVFICIDCSAVHRSLGVHLTFVRSTQLDTNWTWLQLRQMQLGGNANADSFFRQHNCVTTDAQQKYNSRAAQLYREKLHTASVHAMRIHGTKLHIEPSLEHQSAKEEKKEEVDFFEEHSTDSFFNYDNQNLNVDNRSTNGNITAASKPALPPGAGPNVEAALSNFVEPQADRKSIIGGRKPPAKKTGLGAKRGLGAQRVKADFSAIEREAELADQLKAQEKTPIVPEKSAEEQEAQMVSMRLAYQDLSMQQRKEEDKLKSIDPKKAQQVERLGMGFATRSGVSHSAFNNIKVIEQESPVKPAASRYARDDDAGYDDFFDTFSSSSMLKGNRTPTESSSESVFFDSKSDNLSVLETMTNRNAPKGSSGWGESSGGWGEPKSSGGGWGEPKSKGWRESVNDSDWGEEKKKVKEWEVVEPERRQPSTRGGERREAKPAASGSEAQKKFGAAKAISSDQYFADSSDTSWERKTNLSRFEGSSSISSADYFNRTEVLPGGGGGYGGGYGVQTPDLDDVKESVRQGVTKVAGKLSSLANGVMSSIQEKYGGY